MLSHIRCIWTSSVISVGIVLLVAGCGGESEDPCADTTCSYGVCDSETGACRNPESCEQGGGADAGNADITDDRSCLRGFQCVSGVCEAEIPCSDGSCERGVCNRGACVNAQPCDAREDCLEGLGCSSAGVCRDLCVDKTCKRGVCDSETGDCENPETCDPQDESVPSCLESAVCLDGDDDGRRECLGEEAYCEMLDCERGTCSFDARKCVDRETCSEDVDCIEGNYCDTRIGECKTNACISGDDGGETCPRGDCEPETGQCINPDSCMASDDCLPAHSCVDQRCVPAGSECGPSGCPGNQVCDYDETTLAASCVENPDEPCRNAVDCRGNSVCRDGVCVSPEGCQPDALEPNDTTQVSFLDNAFQSTVTANICSRRSPDVDRFSFDVDEARGEALRGQLYIDLSIVPVDVGQGTLTLVMTDQSGRILAQRSTNSAGRIHLERALSGLTVSSLQFEVSGSDVSVAGVRYQLFAGVAPQSTVQACREGTEIVPDDQRTRPGPIRDSTGAGVTTGIGASCIDQAELIPDRLFTFRLKETSYVKLAARTDDDIDLTLALRRYCGSIGSEISCSDLTGAGDSEAIGRRLEPGRYTVVVQGGSPGERGAFELSFEAEPETCTASDDRCLGGATALICSDNRTDLEEVECESMCDTQTGRCQIQPGDACYAPVDAGTDESTTIDWTKHSSSYEPDVGCMAASQDTGGPDVVYQVDVPSGEVLEADLVFDSPAGDGSLYLLRSCGDAEGGCIAATDSNTSSERLHYYNATPFEQNLFLVADSKAGTDFTETDIEIVTRMPLCQPGTAKCSGGDLEVCNDAGTAYRSETCTYGCSSGSCEPPAFDTCGGAVDLTGGGTASASYDDLSRDYEAPEGCAGDAPIGPDAVYRVDLTAGEVLTADIEAGGSQTDPMAYVVSDCSSATAVSASCQRGVDANYAGADETLRFRAPDGYSGTQSYWIVVDSDGDGGDGTYTIDVSTQSSICSPGSRQCVSGSSDQLEICGQFGLQYSSYTCKGSSTTCVSTSGGASCPEPTGDQCADPIPLDKQAKVTGLYDGDNHLSLSDGTIGACEIRAGNATDGPERIYSVTLDAGDLLTADLETTHDDSMLYMMEHCVADNSCQTASLEAGGDQLVQYLADTQETVYVVVDSTFDSGNDLYTLDLSTTPNVTCIPESKRCTGPSSVGVCNATGTAYRSQFQCQTSCRANACEAPGVNVPGPLPHNSCGSAPDVGSGTVVSGKWSRLSNALSVDAGACTPEAGIGRDAVYKIQVSPGQVLKASLESFGDDTPYLYLLENCSDLDTCPAGAIGSDGVAEMTYVASSFRTLYVVADATVANPDDKFRLSIERLNPVCQPGTRTCATAGEQLQVCQENGLYKTRACEGGCQSGACGSPSGDWCPDAISLSSNGSVSGDFDDYSNELDLTRTPTCGIFAEDDAPAGPDAIFEVTDVSTGETLIATLDTDVDQTNMYVMNGCPLGDRSPASRCEWGVSDGDRLEYLVQSDAPLYLAVDTQSPAANENFTLELSTRTGDACQPGGGACTGTSGQTLEVCGSDGSGVARTVSCGYGCSSSGYCELASQTPATCATAMDIGSGTRLRDTTDRFSADFSPACTGKAGGAEAVYTVDVPAGESMQAEVTPVDGGMDPTVYVLPTCGNTGSCTNPDSAVNEPWQRTPAVTGYRNDSGQLQSVAVVVDHGADGGEFELDVEVGATTCSTQGETTCLDDDTLGTCASYQRYRPSRCDFGCDSSASACESVPNDDCSGAVALSADASYRANIGLYTDDHDPAAAGSSCLPTGAAGGADAVYEVQLDQGDVFDATVQTPGDAVLWATTSCSSPGSSCVAAANESVPAGAERLAFTAGTTGTYYIVVDTDDTAGATPPGRFLLEVDHAGPAVCSSGSRTCTGPQGNRMTYCQKPGLSESVRTCAGTCTSGACTQNTGDFCEDAVAAADGDSFTYSYSDYSDEYDLGASSCVGYETAGNERVFEVDVAPGESLSVNANSDNGSDWVQAYVVERCGDTPRVADACRKGADFGGSSGSLTFSPTIASTTTYFVVIDGWLPDTSGQVTVDFVIQ